jgi:L-aspartate oxidase
MAQKYDFLVLGSGIAGLSFALRVADHGTVAVITKKESAESNTNYAQGGIAAVLDASDSVESHVKDTLIAGAGLCDPAIVEIVVHEGPERVKELMTLGAEFSHQNGRLHFGREGGHSANRIVHAADTTGREVEGTLLRRIHEHPNINLFEYHFAVELITEHHMGQHVSKLRPDMHCYGAYVLDEKNDRVETVLAKSTLLATGGSGRVYLHSTNPAIATGDGVAMAYRAKARLENMEFVQFHPTSLYHPEADSFLISEAVRGEGAVLMNVDGERFMPSYDSRAELAPRDIVARAIDDQLKQRGDDYVYLDISHKPAQDILLPWLRNRHHQPTHTRRAGCALSVWWCEDRCARTNVDLRIVCMRRGRVHGSARREPSCVKFTARGAGVRAPGSGHGREIRSECFLARGYSRVG